MTYGKNPNFRLLPIALRDGMQAYIEEGRRPGGFLTAVLENDLSGAFARADKTSREALHEIVRFLYNEIPHASWGSPMKVTTWVNDVRRLRERSSQNQGDKDDD